MILNQYTIQKLEERNAIMKAIATNPVEIQEYAETIQRCVELGWSLILKRVLETLWKQNLNQCRIDKFMEQVGKDGAYRIKHNIKIHMDFYKNYNELGFTPYLSI